MSLATSTAFVPTSTRRKSVTPAQRRAIRSAVAAFLAAADVESRMDARDELMNAIIAPCTTLDVPDGDGIDATHVRTAEVDGVAYMVIFDGFAGHWHLVVTDPKNSFKA